MSGQGQGSPVQVKLMSGLTRSSRISDEVKVGSKSGQVGSDSINLRSDQVMVLSSSGHVRASSVQGHVKSKSVQNLVRSGQVRSS